MIKRETVVAGGIIFQRIYGSGRPKKGEKRKKKTNPTPAAMEEVNRRNAERELNIKLHHNFGPDDIHAVLTYSGDPPTPEEAQLELRKFKQRLRYYWKKHSELGTLKWILVSEVKRGKRIHHHMIISKMDTADLNKLWKAGHVRPAHLDGSGDYHKLTAYLIKQSKKNLRIDSELCKQRFSCSRSVATPPKKVEEVSTKALVRDPKPIKGYSIIPDSVYKGINPVTGVPYLEYTMLATTAIPRYRIWPRGKRAKYKEYYYKLRCEDVYKQLSIWGSD